MEVSGESEAGSFSRVCELVQENAGEDLIDVSIKSLLEKVNRERDVTNERVYKDFPPNALHMFLASGKLKSKRGIGFGGRPGRTTLTGLNCTRGKEKDGMVWARYELPKAVLNDIKLYRLVKSKKRKTSMEESRDAKIHKFRSLSDDEFGDLVRALPNGVLAKLRDHPEALKILIDYLEVEPRPSPLLNTNVAPHSAASVDTEHSTTSSPWELDPFSPSEPLLSCTEAQNSAWSPPPLEPFEQEQFEEFFGPRSQYFRSAMITVLSATSLSFHVFLVVERLCVA